MFGRPANLGYRVRFCCIDTESGMGIVFILSILYFPFFSLSLRQLDMIAKVLTLAVQPSVVNQSYLCSFLVSSESCLVPNRGNISSTNT